VLLAGRFANGTTAVIQPAVTRDHTERLLQHLGVAVTTKKNTIAVLPAQPKAAKITVPGDFSSAIFFMAAAFLLPESELAIFNVGLNATRSYALKVIQRAGAKIVLENPTLINGEEMADITAQTGKLKPFKISGKEIPLVIDEIPILAVLATQAGGTSRIRDAAELRVKESDRIRAIARNLTRMGATIREFDDGFEIDGPTKLRGTEIDTFGDHRIAMAFAIAGLVAKGETIINDAEAAEISYPGFFEQLSELVNNA
jgi:3-phosphoshikimate 1-carboxyvinyltransferase